MKYRDLKNWFRSKRWFEKLFLFFILLRPIVEPYYYLKTSSPFLSPLYWIVFLTFIISLIGIFNSRKFKSNSDILFNLWSLLVVINVLFLYSTLEIIPYFNFAIKLVYPVLIYYFLRTFIKDKSDLTGLLTLFLYASILSVFWLLLDISRHGFNLREQSSYADVVNYGLYASFALIILLYFYYKRKLGDKEFININMTKIILAFVMVFMVQWSIKHMASIAVVIFVTGIFIYYLSKKKRASAFGFFIVAIAFVWLFGQKFYTEVMEERVSKEMEVVEGTREQSQALHGRVTRWQNLADDYVRAGIIPQVLGYPFTMQYSNHMIGINVHNDFLRILFFTGIFGITFYVLFVLLIIRKVRFMAAPEKFLAYASMATFILYSISTVPTFYPGFNNFSFTIMAFIALPLSLRKK